MEPFILISGSMNLFSEGYNGCGVYGISGLKESSFETPIYIGSAIDFKARIEGSHFPRLESDKHVNKPLQNYFNL